MNEYTQTLIEEMVWCWINDVVMSEFAGRPDSETTRAEILAAADKRCLEPLRDAGIIRGWRLSLTKHRNSLLLDVNITLPEMAHAAR